jgi:hypothetical protein
MAAQLDVRVTPILVSNFDWTGFLKDSTSLCGHSPIHGIDSFPYKLKDYAKLIAVLGEFREGKSLDPRRTIQTAGDLLSHLHFGFLVSGSSSLIFQIMELTDLKIISTKMQDQGRVAVTTGTLREWQASVINVLNSNETRPKGVRLAFSLCLDFFEQLGLQGIWHEYRKHSTPGQVYLLERK